MIQRTIILPKRDNKRLSLAHVHTAIRNSLLTIAGGYSKQAQTGAWRDEKTGRVYYDDSWQYTTLVNAEQDKRIMALIPIFCAAARQECILTYKQTVNASFVEPASEQKTA